MASTSQHKPTYKRHCICAILLCLFHLEGRGVPPAVTGQPSTCTLAAVFISAFIHKSTLIEFPLPGFISCLLAQGFSNFNVHTDLAGSLLKCACWFSRAALLTSSQVSTYCWSKGLTQTARFQGDGSSITVTSGASTPTGASVPLPES